MTTCRKSTLSEAASEITEVASMFQAIAEMGEVGICVLDEANCIEFANSLASVITGYPNRTIKGRSFSDFFDEKNRAYFEALRHQCRAASTKPVSYTHLRAHET